VDSETEKGTNFSIHIPFENIPIPKEQVQEETLSRNLKAEAVIPDQKPAKCNTQMLPPDAPTILLVEDNEDFRCYLKEKLQQHHKVIEAENGREGWQKALALHPQLIISDISMPEMDGIDLCKKIKADKRTDHIPIILLTARIGEGDQLKGLETGANDYITKPFNIELLDC
jgi:CheY-like chemotaxis protein